MHTGEMMPSSCVTSKALQSLTAFCPYSGAVLHLEIRLPRTITRLGGSSRGLECAGFLWLRPPSDTSIFRICPIRSGHLQESLFCCAPLYMASWVLVIVPMEDAIRETATGGLTLRRPRNVAGLWFHCTVGATRVLAGIEGSFAATQSDRKPLSAANMRKQRKEIQVSSNPASNFGERQAASISRSGQHAPTHLPGA